MKATLKSIVVQLLIFEAKLLLRRKKPIIIALTGSVGKTTTKDAIFCAIKKQISTRKSEKSFNSEIGVPLTILGLSNAWNNPFLWARNLIDGLFTALFAQSYPKVLILETGIDRPGDMEQLVKWLTPNIVVLTRLPDVPVHVEYFKTPDAVVEEKMKLVSAMKPDGVLIYNADDAVVVKQLPEVLQRQVSFGRYLEASFRASDDRVVYKDDRPTGVTFQLAHLESEYTVTIQHTLGTHYVYACGAALAVADALDLSVATAAESLSSLQVSPGRLRLLPGLKASYLIDDTYNSSPVAVEHALEALSELKYAKRKIAVLGDMLELGKFSSTEHKRIGASVPKVADVLITVGIRARQFAEGALAGGMQEAQIFQYDDAVRAGRELQNFLRPGDCVLVKASQGVRAERIIEEVMAEPEQAAELLVRQERVWKTIA